MCAEPACSWRSRSRTVDPLPVGWAHRPVLSQHDLSRHPSTTVLQNRINWCPNRAPTVHAAGRSPFGPNVDKHLGEERSRQRDDKQGERHQMLRERSAVYDPEELSLLGKMFDQAVAALPATMQTPANRTEIAKIILRRAAADDELEALMRLMVAVDRAA